MRAAAARALLVASMLPRCAETRVAAPAWSGAPAGHGHDVELPRSAFAPPETPDAPFRATRPAAGSPSPYSVPDVAQLTLRNGIDVLLLERHDLPVVRVDVVVPAGWADLPGRPAAVLKAMGALLEKGTATRSALDIASAYDAIGAEHAIRVELESVRAMVKVLASKLDPALDLLRDVVEHPSFPRTEVDLLKGQWLDAIGEQTLDAETLSWNAMELALYGPRHPYGRAYIPTPEEVSSIDERALRSAHAQVFATRRATIVVVGDTTPQSLLPLLDRTFGARERAPAGTVGIPPPPPARSPSRLALVDRPGLAQSLVYVAEPAISWSAPDKEAFALMNIILGGFAMSRLNANLRERLGASYGVSSMSTSWRRRAGPFRAGGAMQVDKTGQAVVELLREVRSMTEREPLAEELEGAKQFLLRSIVARFETTSMAAESLDWLVDYGLPLDEYARWRPRVEAVSTSDVLKVARKYLHPETMKILVVADRAKVEAQLAELGLGALEIRDDHGRLLHGPSFK